MGPVAVVDYQDPATRAWGTFLRQLCLDVLTVVAATVLAIPAEGPVPWRALALTTTALLVKTVAATALKYQRALDGDKTVERFNFDGEGA